MIEKMDDEDTARSGFVDQDLRGVSESDVPSRDPSHTLVYLIQRRQRYQFG